jgi:tetratricopeptide (TPR) repeat protein
MAARTAAAMGSEAWWERILVKIEQAQERLNEAIKLAEVEKYDKAIAIFTEILENTKDISLESSAQVYVQRGRCYWEMRRWEEAAADFLASHKLLPENPDPNWTLCLIYLQMDKFDEAWKYVEHRWKSKKFDSPRLKTSKPQWTKDCGAKHVFVWSEQGIGDQILYLSLLHNIRQECDRLTLMIDVRLAELVHRSFPDIEIVPQNARVKGFDAQIALGSIGAQFIHDKEDIHRYAERNYLKANLDKAEKISASIKQPGERLIGLSWHSGAPRIGNNKSVPMAELMPLFKLPNTRFLSLQYGDCYEDIYELEKQHGVRVGIFPSIDNKDDIDGLAALMTACDAVVTVSNATGHFAGALGRPTYLLNSNKLWYWSNTFDDGHSRWYPSVKVYSRDNVVTPWTEQINKLVGDLK